MGERGRPAIARRRRLTSMQELFTDRPHHYCRVVAQLQYVPRSDHPDLYPVLGAMRAHHILLGVLLYESDARRLREGSRKRLSRAGPRFTPSGDSVPDNRASVLLLRSSCRNAQRPPSIPEVTGLR